VFLPVGCRSINDHHCKNKFLKTLIHQEGGADLLGPAD
jgi:hypothetical protein